MKEHIFLGAYWPSRKESRSECTHRVFCFLKSITDQPNLGNWYLKNRSRKAAQIPVDITKAGIDKHLKTNNRDDNGAPITELGFSFGVWNGSNLTPITFNVTCGAFSNFIGNSAVLTFPEQEPPSDIQSSKAWFFLLEKFIESFEPKVATVTSNEFLIRTGGGMPADKGGYLTYNEGSKIKVVLTT